MLKVWSISLGLATGIVLGSTAQAGSLGVAGNFSEFIFNDSTRSNTESQGQVAVGGNATFNNLTIGTNITKTNIHGTNTLIVGGKLRGDQAVVNGFGNAEYGSSSINHLYYNGGGTGSKESDPSFFSSA